MKLQLVAVVAFTIALTSMFTNCGEDFDDLIIEGDKVSLVYLNSSGQANEQKVSYKNVFSAGQGVANIARIKSTKEVIWGTMTEYHDICSLM